MTRSQNIGADPFFFGYGSLVNRQTHDFRRASPARVSGWRRVWRHSARREAAYLSVEPASGQAIDGLIAAVPGGDWAALDLREAAYERVALAPAEVAHALPQPVAVHLYRTRGPVSAPAAEHPILLSYLDCVVQGFLQLFGPEGADRFFASTEGWETPILNDRRAPRYPRHVELSAGERGLVDDWLTRLRR